MKLFWFCLIVLVYPMFCHAASDRFLLVVDRDREFVDETRYRIDRFPFAFHNPELAQRMERAEERDKLRNLFNSPEFFTHLQERSICSVNGTHDRLQSALVLTQEDRGYGLQLEEFDNRRGNAVLSAFRDFLAVEWSSWSFEGLNGDTLMRATYEWSLERF